MAINKTIIKICGTQCCGYENYHGSCCKIEQRDYIIGPILDTDLILEKLSEKFERQVEYHEVFIDYNEGSQLFPDRSNWQNPNAYPAMRIDIYTSDLRCIFYNNGIRSCSIYDIRPDTCKKFLCEHLRQELQNESYEEYTKLVS